MIYLYVPFRQAEGNSKLMKHAQQWCKTVYANAERPVPCTILSATDGVFASPQSVSEKTKIYILAYDAEGRPQEIASSPNSISPYTINIEQLAKRLLTSGLPTQGRVEIKLCIKQNATDDADLLISAESIKEHLLQMNYMNSELLIRVECSTEPFPGEKSKLAYRSINGSFPLLFGTNRELAVGKSRDNAGMDSDSNALNLMKLGA